jgi:coenzyme F420 hydrogenase subunit beta
LPSAWTNGDNANCRYGDRGCTLCARVCPRFGSWETDANQARWSRSRTAEEVIGVYSDLLLVEATDHQIAEAGQDGGLATALLLYALEHRYIDAALVSFFDDEMRTRPGVARTREELLACAGSRYTYSPNVIAIEETSVSDSRRLGLVSVGCQISIPAVASRRGASKFANRFALVVGLICSRTFTDEIYADLLEEVYGVPRHLITKVNIKGCLQVWYEDVETEDVSYLEVPLSECRQYTRPGCVHCPDFTAEHADLSLGGIGKYAGRTLVIVRSDLGREILTNMDRDNWISVGDALEEDPDAVSLIRKLAARQRKRWPAPSLNPGSFQPESTSR